MSVTNPATAVGEVLAAAADEVLIVAPYIKIGAFRALFDKIKPSATLVCITRWLPEDIASGVCDLEILDALTSRAKSSLFVQPHLHAKYYRGDDRCLVGSANLTARGLGWVTPANVELLVELPVEFPGVVQWEAALRASGVAATPELRDRVAQAAALLKSTAALPAVPEVNEEGVESAPQAQWIPICPVPERLWTVYRGGAEATMVSSARDAAQKDLKALSPPPGLTQPLFTAYVSGILRQMPLMIEIDTLASAGLTDAQAYDFLTTRFGNVDDFSAEQAWRVLKAWLIYFFPTTYRLETGQEVLIRGKELSK
jgi:hypothetical protein